MKNDFGEAYRFRSISSEYNDYGEPVSVVFCIGDEQDMDIIAQTDLLCQLDEPTIERLIITGDEPFDDLRLANDIAFICKAMFQDVKIVVETGYEREYLETRPDAKALLGKCDELVTITEKGERYFGREGQAVD